MMIRNSLFAAVALLMTGCGIYKPYTRPEVTTDGIYREPVTPTDTASLADLDWRALFPDERLQQLIDTVLVRNTDLRTAQLQVEEAEATLRTARLSLLPSFTLAPQGGVSSFDNSKGTWTYNLPVTASWEIDIFSRLRNGKLRNKALYYQSIEYRQAVRTQLIATTANLYFTLCMLDEQYAIANETASAWREAVDAIRAMKDAGMATEAAVAQNEAAYYSVETSVKQLAQSISETENSLCSLLAQTPHKIERGSLESQRMPADLLIGVPVQLLSRRPDVRSAEYSLMSAYYATAEARSALYPQITLSGTAGWTNSAGSQIVNPGQAASVGRRTIVAADLPGRRQPCAREDRQSAAAGGDARLRADDSQCRTRGQRCADRLPDGTRVGNALRPAGSHRLRRAVESTELLMQHGSTTYLEVLTARQSLLSAQLQQVANRFTELQSVVTLYHALGGGRETETAQ